MYLQESCSPYLLDAAISYCKVPERSSKYCIFLASEVKGQNDASAEDGKSFWAYLQTSIMQWLRYIRTAPVRAGVINESSAQAMDTHRNGQLRTKKTVRFEQPLCLAT